MQRPTRVSTRYHHSLHLLTRLRSEFDLAALFFRFTLSSFTKMAFSLDIGAMPLDTNAPPVPFAVAFDFSQGAMARRLVK